MKPDTGKDKRYNEERQHYNRGCIDCANFIVRASLSVPDIPMLKIALRLLASLYIYFGETAFAVNTLERLRDVAVEDLDFLTVMWVYK